MAVATSTLATITVIASALAVVSSGVAAYSSYYQGQQAKKQADFQAGVAENNAKASRQQAVFDADRLRERNRRLAGSQRTAIAKSGGTFSGSAADVVNDSEIQGELDILTTLYKGNLRSGAYQNDATASRMAGKSARTQGYISAGGSLLGGAGDALSIYSRHPKFG
jgi:hypothetical protein